MLLNASLGAGRLCAIAVANNVQQARQLATLKDISMRLKAVTNIKKITETMKLVSAAKYAKAERQLLPAKSYGTGTQAFYQTAAFEAPEERKDVLVVAMTSDRGLCGSAHSNVQKHIIRYIKELSDSNDCRIVCVGEKAKTVLARYYPENILYNVGGIGRLPPTFNDAREIAEVIMNSGYEYKQGFFVYNEFRTVVSFTTKEMPFYSTEAVQANDNMLVFDSVDNTVVKEYLEFSLASMIYYALKEGNCSEQSARMTAMDASSKNAQEMISKLTLLFNRTRQAVITTELIEIISGAMALDDK
jgi:F-type H+-transporting ATPase subunit gamma